MEAFNAEILSMVSPACRSAAMGVISLAPSISGTNSAWCQQRGRNRRSRQGRKEQCHQILLLPYFKGAMEFDGLSAEEIGICSLNVPASQGPTIDNSGCRAVREQGSKERWSLPDLLVLVQAKKEEDERLKMLHPGSRKQSLSSARKWEGIKDSMKELGVVRSILQLRKRWNRLMGDFKKVHDYERHIPSGQPSYYQQDRAKRRDMGLPLDFPQDVYDAMVTWVPAHKNIVPDADQIIETEDLEIHAVDPTPLTPSTPTSPIPSAVPGSPSSSFQGGPTPSRHGSSPPESSTPPIDDPLTATPAPIVDPPPSSTRAEESGGSIPGVTSHYEQFGQKRSRKSRVDAEVRNTTMPRMIDQMSKGLEAHREFNVALVTNNNALLKLKEKEIDNQKDSAAMLSNSMDRVAQSIEFLAQQMGNRMARQ